MSFPVWVILIYGILVFVGGLFGYLRAKSKISLISGVIFGLAIILSGFGIHYNFEIAGKSPGIYLSLSLVGILTLMFTWRFLRTKKFMPSGMMLFLSVIALIMIGISAIR